MDVSVIVVTYQSADCIAACLESVTAQEGVQTELIVVDNASTDRTAAVVRDAGVDLRLVLHDQNVGFGRACNAGFEVSRGRHVYLLNPDAQLVGRNALAELCRAVDQHPRWGMAGTRILREDGTPAPLPPTSYPRQRHARARFPDLPGDIAWVTGASMMVRRDVYTALGGFDPDFFLYSEETDFCLRVRQHGHEIGYVDEVAVRHIGGVSERGSDPYEIWTRRTSGRHLFWKKHFPPDDILRLIRRDQLHARFHLLVNGVLAQWRPIGSRAWENCRRYRAIADVCSKSLSETAGGARWPFS